MHNHIEKLVNATKNITVSYAPGYTQDGNPDIGVRAADRKDVIIDNIPWMISGDIYNKPMNKRINDINAMSWYRANGLYVTLRAQAIIAGQIVQVHLGKRYVSCKSNIANGGGELVLVDHE